MVPASGSTYLSALLFSILIYSRVHRTSTQRLLKVSGPLLDLVVELWGIRQQSLPSRNFILMGVGHWYRGHRQHGVLRASVGEKGLSSRTTHTYWMSPELHLSLSPGSFCLGILSFCNALAMLRFLWTPSLCSWCSEIFSPGIPLFVGFPYLAHCQNHRETCILNPVRLKELTSNKL